jgi:hypothetical protein
MKKAGLFSLFVACAPYGPYDVGAHGVCEAYCEKAVECIEQDGAFTCDEDYVEECTDACVDDYDLFESEQRTSMLDCLNCLKDATCGDSSACVTECEAAPRPTTAISATCEPVGGEIP